MIEPHDCGRGNHDWSAEPLDDGSHYCENPGCAVFLFPELGAVAASRDAAEQFQSEMEASRGEWPPEGEDWGVPESGDGSETPTNKEN